MWFGDGTDSVMGARAGLSYRFSSAETGLMWANKLRAFRCDDRS